jgi:FMN-dependent dehydrogenase
MADPADYYREIYLRGLGGETPAIPVSIAELEERAVAAMDPKAANYVCAGAGSEETMRANREAFASTGRTTRRSPGPGGAREDARGGSGMATGHFLGVQANPSPRDPLRQRRPQRRRVLKALALGAAAVCLGRPYLWGLALDGQAGVETVLKIVLAELDLTMALCGLTGPEEIGPGLLSSGS